MRGEVKERKKRGQGDSQVLAGEDTRTVNGLERREEWWMPPLLYQELNQADHDQVRA